MPKPTSGDVMAKKKATDAEATNGQGQETVSGYFRRLFKEHPKWLDERSNAAILDRWLKDHPDQTSVPKNVQQNLSNVKSVLRSKKRAKPGRKKATEQPETHAGPTETAVSPVSRKRASGGLDTLEEQIDECLTLAKNLD